MVHLYVPLSGSQNIKEQFARRNPRGVELSVLRCWLGHCWHEGNFNLKGKEKAKQCSWQYSIRCIADSPMQYKQSDMSCARPFMDHRYVFRSSVTAPGNGRKQESPGGVHARCNEPGEAPLIGSYVTALRRDRAVS